MKQNFRAQIFFLNLSSSLWKTNDWYDFYFKTEGDAETKNRASMTTLATAKAELLQLKLTPIICVMNFVNKKVGNQKN